MEDRPRLETGNCVDDIVKLIRDHEAAGAPSDAIDDYVLIEIFEHPDVAVRTYEALATDPDPAMRRVAAVSIGRVATVDPAVGVRLWAGMVEDPDPSVVEMALDSARLALEEPAALRPLPRRTLLGLLGHAARP